MTNQNFFNKFSSSSRFYLANQNIFFITSVFYLGKHNKFSSSSISYLPSADDTESNLPSIITGSTRSLPNLDENKLNSPQPPFKSEQLDLNNQFSTIFREKKPKTEQEMDKLAEPIFEQRARAIEQYEKELE